MEQPDIESGATKDVLDLAVLSTNRRNEIKCTVHHWNNPAYLSLGLIYSHCFVTFNI